MYKAEQDHGDFKVISTISNDTIEAYYDKRDVQDN